MFALLLSIPGVGCAPNGGIAAEGFDQLNGLLIVDDGVYVVPDRGWRREGDRGGSFRKTASLLVYIQNDHPDGLRVTYTPDETTRRFHFVPSWDDLPVWVGPRAAEAGALVVEVGGADLSPGLHRLRLDREKEFDAEDDRNQGLNLFLRVQVERIDAGVKSSQSVIPGGYFGRYLDFGVISQKSALLSGCLFRGPREHSFEVDGDSDGLATFTLQNQSRENARFSVKIDGALVSEVVVEPRGRSPLQFDVPPGRRSVTLAVGGNPGGGFLWGAPHLQRRSSQVGAPVILITLDTTRRDAIPPFSTRPYLTPVLERIAQSATAFPNAYATSPWTLPSHASVFTGLYPSHHRAGVSDDVLSRSWITLAEIFRGAGYRTAGFVGGSMASSRFGLAQGFDLFLDPEKNEQPANVIADAAIEFIERHADDPLFLFLNFFDPHASYSAPKEFQDLLNVKELAGSIQDDPDWAAYSRDGPGGWDAITKRKVPPNAAGLEYLRARYMAEVAFMDQQIGRVFDVLESNHLFDDALIVLVADHGEFLGERGLFSHSYRLDRELTAIPLLVKWPHQRTAEVVEELVSHVDLFATIAGAAGTPVPASDGIAFGRGATESLGARERVYLEEHKSRFHQLPGPFRIADHLFGIQWLDAREVFFSGFIECSRRTDDGWVANQCGSSWEQRVSDLPSGLRASIDLKATSSAADIDEEEAEKLRALGYLE